MSIPVTLVQSKRITESGGGESNIIFNSPATDGNTIIVCVNQYSQGGGSVIPDPPTVTGDNTFNLIEESVVQRTGASWGQCICFFAATNITSFPSEVIQAVFEAAEFNWLSIWEVTPANFDTAVTHIDTTSGTTSPGVLTPSEDGAFICSSAQYDASNVAFTPEDEGWTFLVNDTAGGGSTYNASKLQDTATPESCSFTTVGEGLEVWSASAVSFVSSVVPPTEGTIMQVLSTESLTSQVTSTVIPVP